MDILSFYGLKGATVNVLTCVIGNQIGASLGNVLSTLMFINDQTYGLKTPCNCVSLSLLFVWNRIGVLHIFVQRIKVGTNEFYC